MYYNLSITNHQILKQVSLVIILTLLINRPIQLKSQTQAENNIGVRGAWLTTLNNIDWPSSPSLSEATLKQELVKILEFYVKTGINTVFFQIRPAGDAFYRSSYEPWSVFLTGNKGKVPPGNIDPLQLIIDEGHKRGIEIHAWINPFRILYSPTPGEKREYLNYSIHPEWCVSYGKHIYYNPGIPEVREYTLEIIKDVVTNYDIDGIHFDDYFYPYTYNNEPFNDKAAHSKYGANTNIDDWRRSNIDDFIYKTHQYLEVNHPFVKFGVSPFGVWENSNVHSNGSKTMAGVTAYSTNYANVIKWQQNGWIDYLVPQLYWNIGFEVADFKILTDWWNKHAYNRHIYIGHSIYKIDKNSKISSWRNPNEILEQFAEIEKNNALAGSIFYNTSSLLRNPIGATDKIRTYFNAHPAKIPSMPWKKQIIPSKVDLFKATENKDSVMFIWKLKKEAPENFGYILYISTEKNNQDFSIFKIFPPATKSITFSKKYFKNHNCRFRISSFSRTHYEIFSETTILITNHGNKIQCK